MKNERGRESEIDRKKTERNVPNLGQDQDLAKMKRTWLIAIF
jgi:hypothetical protein